MEQYLHETQKRFDEAFPRDIREIYKQGDGSTSAGVVKMAVPIRAFIRSEQIAFALKVLDEVKNSEPLRGTRTTFETPGSEFYLRGWNYGVNAYSKAVDHLRDQLVALRDVATA
jgi:hypothetical protein